MAGRVSEGGKLPGVLGHVANRPIVPPGRGPASADGDRAASFSVRGGPMSIHANLEELERGSALLAQAAAESTVLAVRAAGWGSLMTLAAQQSSLAVALGARTAELSSGLLAVGAEAEVLEQAVGFSARSYREAEERALRAVQEASGVWMLALSAGLAAAGRPVPVDVADLAVHGAPDVIALLLGAVHPGLASGFQVTSDVTGHLARDDGRSGAMSGPEQLYPLLTAGGIVTGLVQIGPVRARPAGEVSSSVMDGSLTGVMDHLGQAREEAAGPGAIRVTAITPEAAEAPDRVWMVALPGTQSGDYQDDAGWSTNPFDVSGIGEAMVLDSQHLAVAVHEALRASGAQEGDAVVFTGYSQGGIHAVRLAADPRIAADFDVQGVVTVGAPTAEISLEKDIEALHLEHDKDVTPGMDGRGNPQGVNRTTVTFSGDADPAHPEEPSLFGAHAFDNYRAHVARLESQDVAAADPDADRLAPVREHLALLTTGTAVSRTVTLERTRPGQPRNPLKAGLGHQFRASAPVPMPATGPGTHRAPGVPR